MVDENTWSQQPPQPHAAPPPEPARGVPAPAPATAAAPPAWTAPPAPTTGRDGNGGVTTAARPEAPPAPEHRPSAPVFEEPSPEVVIGVSPEGDKLLERRSHKTLWGWIGGAVFFLFLLAWPYIAYLNTIPGLEGRGRAFTQTMLAAMILAIAAIGLNIVAGYTGMLSIGHAGFMAVGAYVMAGIAGAGLNPWVTLPIAIVAGVGAGAIVAVFCVHLKGFYLSIVTFLFGVLIATLLGFFVGELKPENRLAGLYPEPDQIDLWFAPTEAFQIRFYMFVAVVLALTLALSYFLMRSGTGRAWKAIRDSDIAARAAGIPIRRYRVISFAVSAGFAGLAGALFTQNPNNSVVTTASFGFATSFLLVFIIVLGGLGTISGPVVGAIGLGVVLQNLYQIAKWDQTGALEIINGVLLIILVVLAPNGAVGMLSEFKAKVIDAQTLKRGKLLRKPKSPATSEADRVPRPTNVPDPQPQQPLLELAAASKIFGGLRAVDAVDCAVWPGTIHSLIGPNGSGKTTTINVITGFYKADEGRVFFVGEDVTTEASHLRAHRAMTRTFQNLQVWRDMPVIENVMVGMQPKISQWSSLVGREDDSVRQRAYGLLEYVGLEHRAWDDAGDLALADLRYLEIARALAADPDLLLLDEPAAGMNPAETNQLTQLIRDINNHGITVFLIEHHMDLVMELSDRVTVLDYGQKIAEGTPEEVQHNPRVIEAYLGAEA